VESRFSRYYEAPEVKRTLAVPERSPVRIWAKG
jgi:hypothetical protein